MAALFLLMKEHAMGRKRRFAILSDDQSESDMTPMIDIVFLLLIFFY